MTSMFVPEPVISLSIEPKDKKSSDQMGKALNRFTKEDPTFRTYVDPESNQTIIRGMGELHLEVYIERMKREYKCEVDHGHAPGRLPRGHHPARRIQLHAQEANGRLGPVRKVARLHRALTRRELRVRRHGQGRRDPETNSSPAATRASRKPSRRARLIGFPIVNTKVTINDGQSHPVDSSDIAFQLAAIGAFREAYEKAKPVILEPIMKVDVEGPTEFQGNFFASINQRRGMIVSSSEDGVFCKVEAEVPLSEMFGYSTVIRSLCQGKAEFTMEFLKYGKVPTSVAEQLRKDYLEKRRAEQEDSGRTRRGHGDSGVIGDHGEVKRVKRKSDRKMRFEGSEWESY